MIQRIELDSRGVYKVYYSVKIDNKQYGDFLLAMDELTLKEINELVSTKCRMLISDVYEIQKWRKGL